MSHTHTHTHTHIHFTAVWILSGITWVGCWILLKQETVSVSGISWTISKLPPRSRQMTMPAPHHSVFTGQMPFLLPNQQHQSTEGIADYLTVCEMTRCGCDKVVTNIILQKN